jgi:hypothetical protein
MPEGTMWCQDPFLSCLRAFGYSVVRLPGADLAPLQLLMKLGRELERLGPVEAVLAPGRHVPLPPIVRDRPAPALSGQCTAALDGGLGLSRLASLVAGLGGKPTGLHALYNQSATVTFEFTEVSEDSLALADLDQYLADARVNSRSRHVAALLDADDLYVTTAVVKSRSFGVIASDEEGTSLALDVPVVQAAVGANVHVGGNGSGRMAVTYEGLLPLAFAFRAVRLFYDGGRYQAFKPLHPSEAALSRQPASPQWYQSESAFAPLRLG